MADIAYFGSLPESSSLASEADARLASVKLQETTDVERFRRMMGHRALACTFLGLRA